MPYSESIFCTCKYRPDYPYKGFADLQAARAVPSTRAGLVVG